MDDLIRDIDPGKIYGRLNEDQIITFDEEEEIDEICPRTEAVSELIKLIQRRGPEAFHSFLNALEHTYPDHYTLLLESERKESESSKSKLWSLSIVWLTRKCIPQMLIQRQKVVIVVG